MNKELENRAEDIFSDLLALPAGERSKSAHAACGPDTALLARVQSLLQALPQVDGFMAAATIDPHDARHAQALTAQVGEKPGDKIGRYKLLEQIGEGGFGVVFTAEQTHPVRRKVAIKVIKLGMDTREVVTRFEAERQALAMMDHPNIAKVLDAGATETGRPYFVMELVRGSTVTEYADKHRLGTAERVALAAQICRAVQHAHSKGIIHRDLKPSNVLVTVTDDKPVPKVIDFGIAKATQTRLTDHTLYTAHRQLIGTPQYMSPEQADSDGSDIDTRTDVYSLGVLLYELLVGATPFDAKVLRSAAYDSMRKMIRDSEIPHPSTRLHTMAANTQGTIAANRSTDLKKLNQSVKGELDWIVMKALEKDRTRRYDTAAALADDLNRYLHGDAVLAGPVSGTYRLKKTLKRYKAAAMIAGAIAACLLLGVAGTTWGLIKAKANAAQAVASEQRAVAGETAARREKTLADTNAAEADRQRQAATASEQDARAKETEAKATLKFFTNLLSQASPRKAQNDKVSKVLVDSLITPALKTINQQFFDQPLVRASIQVTLGETLYSLGRVDLAEPQAKAALDARRRLLGDDDPQTLHALSLDAKIINAQGRHAEAEPLYKHVWDVRRRTLGDDDPDTVVAMGGYALTINNQGRFAEAEPLDKQYWDGCRRVLGDDNSQTRVAMNNYAMTIDALGRHKEAEGLEKQHLDACRKALGDDHPGTLLALSNYAGTIKIQGRNAEAEPLYKQLWEADRRVLGDDHRSTQKTGENYAKVLDALGRGAEAVAVRAEVARGSIAASQRTATTQPAPDLADADDDLLNRRRGLLDQPTGPAEHPRTVSAATRPAWIGLATTEPVDPVGQATDPDALIAKGKALSRAGLYAEAEPLLKHAWDGYRHISGDNAPTALLALTEYAVAIDGQSRHAEAEPLLKQCWDASRQAFGDDDLQTIHALSHYALAVDGQGRHSEAEPLLKRCWDLRRKVLGDNNLDTRLAATRYAKTLEELGRGAEAAAIRSVVASASPATTPPSGMKRPATASTRPIMPSTGLKSSAQTAVDPKLSSVDLIRLGTHQRNTGDHEAAEASFREALRQRQAVVPPVEMDIAEALSGLGNAMAYAGSPRLTEAETNLRQALEIRRRINGHQGSLTRRTAKVLADLLDLTGHNAESATIRADAGLPAPSPTTRPGS